MDLVGESESIVLVAINCDRLRNLCKIASDRRSPATLRMCVCAANDPATHNWPLETFHYFPDKDLAIASAAAYGIILNIIGYRIWRRKSYWGWLAPTAAGLLATGFSLRYYMVKDSPDTLALNYLSQIFLVAPAAGYLIFNYTVYRKILDTFATGRDRYSLLPAKLTFWGLTASTLVAFVLQGAGAGLRATPDNQSTGRILFLAGVIVSALVYGVFITFLVHSQMVFRNDLKFDRSNFPWLLLYVLYASSLAIVIRTIYRLAELGQGNDGELATHEKYFYALDVLPLACAITIYAIFWPGSLIAKASAQEPAVQMSTTGAYRV
ncbi:hypothetical protein ACEPAI_9817 [Sanghuangporus weigelae]